MNEKDPGATILIVDDTPANLALAVAFLEEQGLHTVVAQDGKEALRRATLIIPDLILLDVMMPGMNGFEVCRELKARIATRDIPVIFMTALTDTASKLEAFKAGGVDYLSKPMAIDEMLARVTAHVALRMTQVELKRKNEKLQHEAALRQQAESTLQDAYDELKSAGKRLEQAKGQLLKGARIVSIGMLSNGVAQQIAHPIAALRNKLDQLEEDIRTGSSSGPERHDEARPTMAALATTLQAARDDLAHMDDVVQTLHELAAQNETAWRPASITQLLDDTITVLHGELGRKATIIKHYADVPAIACHPVELMQVFMNLLLNAVQAIPDMGEIRIATGCAEQEVWIDIADTGVGIESANLTRIFDPFFSTKPSGRGSGLGLSLSFASIKRHHGRIEVNSAPGQGSTFRVWLPQRQPLAAGSA